MGLSLYKILYRFKALLWESIILLFPPPMLQRLPIAIPLHDHCTMHAFPPTSLLYAIHHTMLVMAISCKGLDEVCKLIGCCRKVGGTVDESDRGM